MVAEVFSAMIQGIEGQIVKIQVDISNGLPNFNMIGYLSNEVKESKERVRTALNNIGVLLPPKRISVNFAPADFRKCGTSFDIGVAAAILLAMDFVPETYIKDTLFVGELSLNGQICPISGVLPIVVAASKRGIKRCIVAQENVAEAAFVGEVMGLRPIMRIHDHAIVTETKVRGDKAIVPKILDLTVKEMIPQTPYCIVYGNDESVRDEMAQAMTKKVGYPPAECYQIGAAIAINAGPKVTGVIFKAQNK